MQLSPHFHLDQLTVCPLLPFLGWEEPDPHVVTNLQRLARTILEPLLGIHAPIEIVRCWTAPRLADVGFPLDAHMEGRAVDLRVRYWSLDAAARWISCNLTYRALDIEPQAESRGASWLHVEIE